MESWKRKLRMGMVGGGQGAFIGAVHRIAAALDQQIELVAGCFSRDPDNSKLTGSQLYLDPARCYNSFQAMADAEAKLPVEERIDFVAVVTPNASHYAVAKAFLDAGIHVVCDKPLTCTVNEADDLVALVQKTGLVFALTHNYTAHPLIRHARELFRSGSLGALRKVVAEYLQDWLARPVERDGSKQAAWRTDPAQSGVGGALGDIGTHAFNLAEYVTGDQVVELCCDKASFVSGRRLDDDANILLRFAGGAKGLLTCSQIATGEENALKLRAYAAEGGIAWEQENPNYLKLYRLGQPVQNLGRGHADYLATEAMTVTRTPAGHPEGYLEAFATIYCGAVEAIRRHIDGKPMRPADYRFPTVHDGLRGVKFIHRAVESAEKGGVWLRL